MAGAKKTRFIKLTAIYIGLIVVAVLCIYPALWIIMSSFREGNSLYSETIIPRSLTLAHYKDLFEKYPYGQWFLNTLKISLISMVLSTFLVTLTGYVFSRFRFAGRRQLMLALMVVGMFPGFMSMIAIYILLAQMKLQNTHLSLILVYAAGSPIGFLYIKSFFDTIPGSLIDAAKIDGANHFSVFARIILPLSKPAIVFAALTSFIGGFVDFIFANLILTTQDKQTLAVGLFNMVNQKVSTEFTMFAAGSVLVAIPITLLFILLQRFLIEGLTAGAEKG